MEARIQLALQSHRADQAPDSPFRFRLRRPALLGGFGGVLVVAAWCVAALCLFVLAGRRGAAKHPAEHPAAGHPAEQAVTSTPASISTPESQSPFVTPGAGAVHPRAVRLVSSRPSRGAAVAAADAGPAASLVSFPAPPMPLTEQERLLLVLAHRRGQARLAGIDAQKQEARETEQFQEFFKPEPSIVVNDTPPAAVDTATATTTTPSK